MSENIIRDVVEHLRAKRFDEALRCADSILERDNTNGAAWLGKGNCLFQLKRIEEAMQCFRQAVFHSPLQAEAWFSKGFTELAAGREAAANRSFQQFLCVAAKNSIELIGEAKGYLKDLAKKGFQPVPHSPPSLIAEGYAHEQKGRHGEAVGFYEQALVMNPAYSLALGMKARCLSNRGDFVRAADTWDKYLKRMPRKADGWRELARALREIGKPEEALAAADRAVALNPAEPRAFAEKAEILRLLGRTEEAKECRLKASTARRKAGKVRTKSKRKKIRKKKRTRLG